MSRVLYLTFNDMPSGIYEGQVVDVCRYLEEELQAEVLLCAFVSVRQFGTTKKNIEMLRRSAVVKRMVPRARNWRWNRFALSRIVKKFRPDVIIARGPFAANLALDLRSKKLVSRVVFDARGAYIAELGEYNVVPDEKVKLEIASLERRAVAESDMRLAVSGKLVSYWKEQFGYTGSRHVIIPCTLNSRAMAAPGKQDKGISRREAGFSADDVLLVYAGSVSGWQTLNETPVFRQLLQSQDHARLLFLSAEIPAITELRKEFPGRVKQQWVKPGEVNEWLRMCDYGWLVREKSVTNSVASPVKFAEYLAAGLHVIISEGLGDYTELVAKESAGLVFKGGKWPELKCVDEHEKERLRALAMQLFTKASYRDSYRKLCDGSKAAQ